MSWTPPIASDNSGTVALLTSTHNPGGVFDIGTTTVTYTATDPYSNEAVASFSITVTGMLSPCFQDIRQMILSTSFIHVWLIVNIAMMYVLMMLSDLL